MLRRMLSNQIRGGKMSKIDNTQLQKLLETINKYHILESWILNICNIKCLNELSIVQYNYLLAIIISEELFDEKTLKK